MAFLIFALLACPCCAPPQCVGPYPRTAMHASPAKAEFFPGGVGAEVIDTVKCRDMARWDVLMPDVSRSNAGARFQVTRLIRSFNPGGTMQAWVDGYAVFKCADGWSWEDPHVEGCDTTTADFNWSRMLAVRANNALMYSLTRAVTTFPGPARLFSVEECCPPLPIPNSPRIDFAMPGVAQALADTIVSWATETPGLFNGVHVDQICRDMTFEENYGDSIDYTRAGFGNREDWRVAYTAGVELLLTRIKTTLPPHFQVTANCGPLGYYYLNGHMRENFPYQNGGTWATNMFGHQGVPEDTGYLGGDVAHVAPTLCWLLAFRDPPYTLPQADLEAQRRHRYVLGSATLGDGVAGMSGTSQGPNRGYLSWWADEFAVTPIGQSSPDVQYKGWLGRPLGEHYASGAGWRRDFQGGAVLVNPTGSPITFDLSGPDAYFRIKGVVCPTVNTGARALVATVPADDALFLQKRQ